MPLPGRSQAEPRNEGQGSENSKQRELTTRLGQLRLELSPLGPRAP